MSKLFDKISWWKNCRNKFRCPTCKKLHHSLLYIESARQDSGTMSNGLSANSLVFVSVVVLVLFSYWWKDLGTWKFEVKNLTSCMSSVGPNVQIFLCEAIIHVRDYCGNYQTCRCLLDCGFIYYESMYQKVRIKQPKS